MENKNLENCKNEESEEIINDSGNETEVAKNENSNTKEISLGKENNSDCKENILDEKEKNIEELQNKNSFLKKICGGVVVGCILALFIFNSVRNNSMEKKINETAIKYKNQIETANENAKKIEAEYAEYKSKMQPYENMQLAEKEKKEEEAKGYDTGITYDELARNPDKNKGKKVTFTGTVIQVIRGNGEDQFRVRVNNDYKKIIFVSYIPKSGENKILENDKVVVRGVSVGEISYKSTMGGKISIPGITAHSIEIK